MAMCKTIKINKIKVVSNITLSTELLRRFHNQRIEKVGFMDFLYFSLLIATSNSFGDILPNTSAARLVVSLQLLIGIILIGYILSKIFPN